MIVCVTGKMASGKNFVSSILENCVYNGRNFVSIDADSVVHSAILDFSVREKIFSRFSKIANEKKINLKNKDGSVNRYELSKIVFSSKSLLAEQEKIVYPYVENFLEKFIEQNSQKNVILNATLLYKIPLINSCEKIIFVWAPFFLRLKRAKSRDNLKISEILLRFFHQRKLFSKYCKLNADIHKVRNCGNSKKIEQQLKKIF